MEQALNSLDLARYVRQCKNYEYYEAKKKNKLNIYYQKWYNIDIRELGGNQEASNALDYAQQYLDLCEMALNEMSV